MARIPTLGRQSVLTVNIIIAAGADAIFPYRYEHCSGGKMIGIDMTGWKAFMAFAKNGEVVMECDQYVTLNEKGDVLVHIPASVTSGLSDGVLRYNIVLEDTQHQVINFVEGDADISHIIAEVK